MFILKLKQICSALAFSKDPVHQKQYNKHVQSGFRSIIYPTLPHVFHSIDVILTLMFITQIGFSLFQFFMELNKQNQEKSK